MNALSVRGLTKTYRNGVQALKGVDLEVERGDFFALLGPNGAGKTTLIGIITSLVNKTGGEARVFGYDIDREPEAAKACIGIVPQELNFNMFESPYTIVVNQAGFYGIPRAVARERAEKYLKQLQLWDKRRGISRALSGGMKRRLMIARALMHEPRLLILDEPTTGLDPQVRQEIWQKLEELRRVSGVTILLSTHYMEEAEKLCERLVVIDRGQILATGAPRDLVLSKVSRYALEVRDVGDLPLHVTRNGVSAVARNNAHFYFAAEADTLTPLMKEYEGRRRMIRLSNLEDVFLQLVSDNESEPPAVA